MLLPPAGTSAGRRLLVLSDEDIDVEDEEEEMVGRQRVLSGKSQSVLPPAANLA